MLFKKGLTLYAIHSFERGTAKLLYIMPPVDGMTPNFACMHLGCMHLGCLWDRHSHVRFICHISASVILKGVSHSVSRGSVSLSVGFESGTPLPECQERVPQCEYRWGGGLCDAQRCGAL